MTTTDTDALTELIYRETFEERYPGYSWESAPDFVKEAHRNRYAAVLPIVAEEVRKAKAEALRDAADSVHDNAASPYCLPCHRDDANLLHTIADQIEAGGQA